MKNAALIAGKEWREFFNSPVPYVFLTVFFLLLGWFFTSPLFLVGEASLNNFFGPMPLLLIFFLPAFTMRLFAEEYKTGTIEPLSALPLTPADIVLGKYAAALGLWALILLLSLFYAALLFFLGSPDPGQMAAGFLGAFLLGGLYAAAGLFASSLSRSQVTAFLVGFLFCFTLFLCGRAAQMVPGWTGAVIAALGVEGHFEAFLRGVVDLRDVMYFLTAQALFLCATLAYYGGRRP